VSSIMKRGSLVLGMVALVAATGVAAEGPALACPPPRGFAFAAEGCGRILRFGADGRVAWECPAPMARDVWVLPNGNVLFPYNEDYNARSNGNPSGVREVAPDGRVVFQFATTGQVFSCQRMGDGSTLVGAASQGKLLVVSPTGAIVREIRVRNAPGHSCMRNARALEGGGFLVAEESAKAAREYAADGTLVREFAAPFPVYSAIRLADGGTLICGKQGMIGFDRAARQAWSLDAAEFPTLGIRWFAGVQALDDGTVFVCNAGGAVPFFILDPRTRRIAWRSHDGKADLPIGHGIHLPGAADAGRK
jgi:hypothetical protein